MSHKDPIHRLSIIETAMLHFHGKRDRPPLSEREANWTRDLEDEIRLDRNSSRSARQSQPSMGLVLPWTSKVEIKREPLWRRAILALSGRIVPLASHLLSAAAGAAVMWYAMSEPLPSQAPPALTARVPNTLDSPAIATPPPITAAMAQTEQQVRNLLEQWRQAWSRRDAQAYLALYSDKFVPVNGKSRTAWAESRRKNFLNRTSINVQLHALKVYPLDDRRVSVSLVQDYVSDRYTELGRHKTLMLVLEGKDWRIASEREG